MKCLNPGCGENAPREARYCPYCGMPLSLSKKERDELIKLNKRLREIQGKDVDMKETKDFMDGLQDGTIKRIAEFMDEVSEPPSSAS